jgi:short-subunit dehydrogenase
VRWTPEGAVTIVTGASSGIGRSLCELLAARGSHVVAIARRRERLDELAQQSAPGRIIPLCGDVTDGAIRRESLRLATEIRGGEIDLLINNAGIGAIGPFAEANEDRLRRIMEVNFFAPAELSRLCIPALRRGRAAVICNIGSVLGHRAVPDKSEYCASKFALHGLSDSLRAELKPEGIQVTLVSPSTTRSEFFSALVDTESSATSKSMGSWTPERVARSTLAAICARRREVILSLAGKGLVYADRFAPPLMNLMLAKPAAR